MPRYTRWLLAPLAAVSLTFAAAGCGDDDGASVREIGDDNSSDGSGSASGSGSGSASASGTDASETDTSE